MSKIDWSDEQAVRDAFVDAVHGLNLALVDGLGAGIVRERFEGNFEWGASVHDGRLLRRTDIPENPDDASVGLEILEGHVSGERFANLMSGQGPTGEEVALWRDRFAESIFNDPGADCDVYPSWGIETVVHSDGREAFLVHLGGGYSFTEPWAKYICGARTLGEAVTALQSEGFMDVDDFRTRWKQVA